MKTSSIIMVALLAFVSAPARANDGAVQFHVATAVPFSTAQLHDAVKLRHGPALHAPVRVAISGDDMVVVAIGASTRSVRLLGRRGLAAARIVAIVIVDLATPPRLPTGSVTPATPRKLALATVSPSPILAPPRMQAPSSRPQTAVTITRTAQPLYRRTLTVAARSLVRRDGNFHGGALQYVHDTRNGLGWAVELATVSGSRSNGQEGTNHSVSSAVSLHTRFRLGRFDGRAGPGVRFAIELFRTYYTGASGISWSPFVGVGLATKLSRRFVLELMGEAGQTFMIDNVGKGMDLRGRWLGFQLAVGRKF